MTADSSTTPEHDATRQGGWRDDFARAAHAPGPTLTALGEAREERRAKVLKLHLAGVPIRRIATTLGVSKDTIEKDLAAARRAVIGGLPPSRIHEVVAHRMAAPAPASPWASPRRWTRCGRWRRRSTGARRSRGRGRRRGARERGQRGGPGPRRVPPPAGAAARRAGG